MAISNRERVDKALELLRKGLAPYVERELQSEKGKTVPPEIFLRLSSDPNLEDKPIGEWDVAALLKLMVIPDVWNTVFRITLGNAERSLVSELRDWRNKWAHQKPFSSADTDRALDSAVRLLTAVSATQQADEIDRMKKELRRLIYDEQVRSEKRKAGRSLIETAANTTLTPWREIITPHKDVAGGWYQQAEFAADLWQTHLGEGPDEYRDPKEFFRRTFLTESLKRLLTQSVKRITNGSGDPVVQLQTNFGGGKTHSMLALYHLFSGTPSSELAGADDVLREADVPTLPEARRVVLVGNKISPGNPVTKPDGTVVRTLWGELAWQLGGPEAFEQIRADDENATNPGDRLRELFEEYGPCVVLIDEWVAYARQLHDRSNLPGGSFETQFSFAQALTESAKLANRCLLVISLPASDTGSSPHAEADDVEVGGLRGREALDRLGNVIGRLEAAWRPASAEESFEIVRRRLFEPLGGPDAFTLRDVTARAFTDLYRGQRGEFPSECSKSDYEKRIQAAYPIHPEIFDRLYDDWSALLKFQRTRGVLRLMAAVIHALWASGDRNPLILPSMIPMDDIRVRPELTRYLTDNWVPIIEKDIDGPNALPLRIDAESPNLGKLTAARRVARTIFLGSAPTTHAAQRGLEDRRVKLGCVMPGESPAVFGDALRHLTKEATYLYQDGSRVWYSTQPTVTKLAQDRAAEYERNPDKVNTELERRLRNTLRDRGGFSRIHALPRSASDVPDDTDARLVVLTPEHAHNKEQDSDAIKAARAILEMRGNAPRLYRNTLVFLVADRVRLQDLHAAVCLYLAWESILNERESLNLDPHQTRQAETQKQSANETVQAQLPETWQWLLAPEQKSPQEEIAYQAILLRGSDGLAERAYKRLVREEMLVRTLGPTILRKHMDEVPLWRGNHVQVRQLVDDFAQYPYLPRLHDANVLLESIGSGPGCLTWAQDTFAFADSYDENAERYPGLRAGENIKVTEGHTGLVVKPEAAKQQLETEIPASQPSSPSPVGANNVPGKITEPGPGEPLPAPRPTRYYGSVQLDATRVGRDAGQVAEEVIAHLAGIVGADVKVTLDIEADIPSGASEQVVRTVTENGRTLKFKEQGFEEE